LTKRGNIRGFVGVYEGNTSSHIKLQITQRRMTRMRMMQMFKLMLVDPFFYIN